MDKILIGWSEEKLGVDIERNNRDINSSKIIKRFFSNSEKRKFEQYKGDNLNSEFIKTWILKEAAIKYHHGKIANDIGKWQISDNFRKAIHKKSNFCLNTLQFKFKDFSLGIASKKNINKIYPLLCIDEF